MQESRRQRSVHKGPRHLLGIPAHPALVYDVTGPEGQRVSEVSPVCDAGSTNHFLSTFSTIVFFLFIDSFPPSSST